MTLYFIRANFLDEVRCYAALQAVREGVMRAVFVMVKTEPGHVEDVALRIADLESFSEAYSTSGQFDLLCKFYVEDIESIGRLVNSEIGRIAHVRDTFTILTFNAFPAPERRS